MVDINEGAQLDTSQIDDRRGMSGGGKLAIGGGAGIVGIIITLIAAFLNSQGGNSSGLSQILQGLQNQTTSGDVPTHSSLSTDCQTGADAAKRDDCRIVAYVNSI